jgi:hypothetical protein
VCCNAINPLTSMTIIPTENGYMLAFDKLVPNEEECAQA